MRHKQAIYGVSTAIHNSLRILWCCYPNAPLENMISPPETVFRYDCQGHAVLLKKELLILPHRKKYSTEVLFTYSR